MDMNKTYIQDILQTLLLTPSPSGFCQEIMREIENEATDQGYQFELTRKGCGVITIPGEDPSYVVGLSAHVDTLGAMVRSITSNGTIKMTSIGGYMLQSIEGEYVTIHTREGKEYSGTILITHPSVHVYADAAEQKRSFENMEVRIDEIVKSEDDVRELGIEVGDFISFDPRSRFFDNGYVKSRHLDDKAGVAAIMGLMKYYSETNTRPLHTVKIFISTYEEIGHGSSYIPEDIDELLAVDMGAMGDDLRCTEMDVSICAKDSSGPYDYNMVSKLIDLAKGHDIDHVVDIYPQYGSDVSAALRAGHNIRGALIGPGVHASHSLERSHMNAICNTASLLYLYTSTPE